jgi:hypothetical protein
MENQIKTQCKLIFDLVEIVHEAKKSIHTIDKTRLYNYQNIHFVEATTLEIFDVLRQSENIFLQLCDHSSTDD